MKVAQKLKEPDVPRQVELADTAKHSQVGLQEGEQALRTIFVDVPACVFLSRMIDELMHVALHRPVATGGVRVDPTARLDGKVCSLLHRLHGEVFGRLDDDRALATKDFTVKTVQKAADLA